MATGMRRRNSRGPDALFSYLIPMVIIGLTIADYSDDGKIDKYLLGILFVYGLAAAGYRVDTLMEKYLDGRTTRRDDRYEDDDDEPAARPRKPRANGSPVE